MQNNDNNNKWIINNRLVQLLLAVVILIKNDHVLCGWNRYPCSVSVFPLFQFNFICYLCSFPWWCSLFVSNAFTQIFSLGCTLFTYSHWRLCLHWPVDNYFYQTPTSIISFYYFQRVQKNSPLIVNKTLFLFAECIWLVFGHQKWDRCYDFEIISFYSLDFCRV